MWVVGLVASWCLNSKDTWDYMYWSLEPVLKSNTGAGFYVGSVCEVLLPEGSEPGLAQNFWQIFTARLAQVSLSRCHRQLVESGLTSGKAGVPPQGSTLESLSYHPLCKGCFWFRVKEWSQWIGCVSANLRQQHLFGLEAGDPWELSCKSENLGAILIPSYHGPPHNTVCSWNTHIRSYCRTNTRTHQQPWTHFLSFSCFNNVADPFAHADTIFPARLVTLQTAGFPFQLLKKEQSLWSSSCAKTTRG